MTSGPSTARVKTGNAAPLHARRRRLMRLMGPGSYALLPAAPRTFHSNDVEHRYRPDSDLFYLSGLAEPRALMVLAPEHAAGDYWLLVRPRDAAREVWTGPRVGLEGARERFGARRVMDIAQTGQVVDEVLSRARTLYQMPGRDPAFDELLRRALTRRRRAGRRCPRRILDLRPLVHEMRLRKDETEIATMRRAAAITCTAHREAMSLARPGMMEYQVEAHVDHVFRSRGASGPAYPTIVGSGPNGVILHHIENGRRMRDGDLVLLDAGCEVGCYSSDVTRTFPVNGRFRSHQQRLYEVVLAAQRVAIAAVRPGVAVDRPHREAVSVLAQGLVDLGILPGPVSEVVAAGTYRRYFMHHTSHWLGLDVHDVGGRQVDGRPRRLAAGMILTVEPGLYIAAGERGAAAPYAGTGIRIEDDVLVTGDGHRVLTAGAPRSPAAVERACRRPRP